jgi:hypothetical protein
MTDDELPEDEDASEDETPDLPPPSTFAGRARQADEQEEPPDEFDFDEEEDEDADEVEEPGAVSGSGAVEADEPAADEVPDTTSGAGRGRRVICTASVWDTRHWRPSTRN